MCGLPTETDEDVLAIADMAHRVIEAGRRAAGRRDIACTISIGAFVPKPHTPFQWVAQTDPEIANDRMRAVRRAGFAVALAGVVMLLALQFGTGALAAFIATPCAGPFMGVALGAALVLPFSARGPRVPRWPPAAPWPSCSPTA